MYRLKNWFVTRADREPHGPVHGPRSVYPGQAQVENSIRNVENQHEP